MSLTAFKDPDAVIDYANDWSDGYLAAGETVLTSGWVVDPGSDTQLLITATTLADPITSCTVSGGTVGQVYALRNRITTNQGRTEDRTWVIRAGQR
jgi:hypothetical protein